MRILRTALLTLLALIVVSPGAPAQGGNSSGTLSPVRDQASAQLSVPPLPAASFNQAIDRMVEREHFYTAQMRHLHPLAETYIQNLKPDKEMGEVPSSDQYFLGRLDLSNGAEDRSFLGQPGFGTRLVSKLTSLYSVRFLPLGFAQMVILDDDLQRKAYDFTFVRREFLGEVRCLVIDVQPKPHTGDGRFLGANNARLDGSGTVRTALSQYKTSDPV